VEFDLTLAVFQRKPLKHWIQLRQLLDGNTMHTERYHQFVQANDDGRTAVVANVGLWMNTMEEYVEAFDILLAWLDSFQRDKVLAFFRPSVPGHVRCSPSGRQPPYENYDEYSNYTNSQERPFNWHLMESFNAHSKSVFAQRHGRPDHLPIDWLNVFPSTILRRDGHVRHKDCLHYSLPGPPDWWVHFLFTMLLDMAAENDK
jgi:hypothetical protein